MFLRALLVTVAILGLSACETIEGAGQDLEKAGEAIQDEANEE
ncbi:MULTISPECIES: entericidin A/B family lipoprotein [Idiomarina]|jgi:predicted small secreted protein|nr:MULTISPECIES: entericidin A/B family lipoprotein [Idiomarina]MBF38487.1 entericidin, EcnA/B family [Idiomarinaceae bacterium]MCH2455733.1 entericidin A/B family lipoprotein [Idiomarina sp.]MCJ8315662.1 entericidin A/B family lipoprotein [Idiomarina sp.]NQZ15577.1 entericidin A/B family lipoprotein [Idiomarina sp.]WPZ02312.1 entericidin A/B family lipoprotein [Idiomarina sp. OXR-189]|tara:strand:+ start:377 stop:505 length:129 start_codon:yes stop_codon:yes gene_type:complete